VQVNQIAGGTSGKEWGEAECIPFSVCVIVQGQGHRETFSKKR